MPAKDPTPVESPPETFDLTLEEFCRRLSATDTRVEMVAGFYADETAAGRVKDSSEAFDTRYAAFQSRPV